MQMSASYLSEPFQNTLTNLLGVWKQYQTNILIFSHLGGSWLTFIQLRPPEMMIQSVILINLSWDQLYSQLRIYTAYVVYRLVYFTSHGSVIQDTERGLDIYDSRIWSFCHMQFTSTGILFCFETNKYPHGPVADPGLPKVWCAGYIFAYFHLYFAPLKSAISLR